MPKPDASRRTISLGARRDVSLEAACRGHGTFVVDMTGMQFAPRPVSVPWRGRTAGRWPSPEPCGIGVRWMANNELSCR
jgi:hypothetical protein